MIASLIVSPSEVTAFTVPTDDLSDSRHTFLLGSYSSLTGEASALDGRIVAFGGTVHCDRLAGIVRSR